MRLPPQNWPKVNLLAAKKKLIKKIEMARSLKRDTLIFLVQFVENNYANTVINPLERIFFVCGFYQLEQTQNKKNFSNVKIKSSLLVTRLPP